MALPTLALDIDTSVRVGALLPKTLQRGVDVVVPDASGLLEALRP